MWCVLSGVFILAEVLSETVLKRLCLRRSYPCGCSLNLLIFFLKKCKWTFLYLCNLILKTEVCDGANRWLTLTMWRAKPTILFYFIQRLYNCPCSSTVLDCYLAVFLYSNLLFQWLHSGYDVHYIVCFELRTSILYLFFNCLVPPVYWADYFLGTFMFFGTLLEYKLTRIS